MTRTVTDAALMLNAMTGYDPRDAYALPQEPRDWRIGIEQGVARLRIAYAPTLEGARVDAAVAARVRATANELTAFGAIVEEAEPPLTGVGEVMRITYGAALAAAVRAVPEAQRALVDPDLLAAAAEGEGIDLIDYFAAMRARETLTAALNVFFQRFDALLLPTMPITAIEAGELVPVGGPYRAWYEWTPFTGPFNLTRVPAASIPCGFVNGLPVGLQVVGPLFREVVVLRICRACESAKPIVPPPL
jgi:aspartyl-tRNA(Asn)/glutamyl-tRNA(Gln) amidotransferase subunit A